jgi:hypothetical protein
VPLTRVYHRAKAFEPPSGAGKNVNVFYHMSNPRPCSVVCRERAAARVPMLWLRGLTHSETDINMAAGDENSFAIRFDKLDGNEQVACPSANCELGARLPERLPDRLKADDLAPLPVSGLDELAAQSHQKAAKPIGSARLAAEVTQ